MNELELSTELETVLNLIDEINNEFKEHYNKDPYHYYMNGHCFYYAHVLKDLYGDNATIWRSNSHCVTKVGGYLFDVCGPIMEGKDKFDLQIEKNDYVTELDLCPTSKDMRDSDKEKRDYLIESIKSKNQVHKKVR